MNLEVGEVPIQEFVRTNRQKIRDNGDEIDRVERRMTGWIKAVEKTTEFNTKLLISTLITAVGSLITGVITVLTLLT